MKKNFVLDTNVLLHDPQALFRFEDNNVCIPIYVIEEIDSFKKGLNELGRNARMAARTVDEYRKKRNLQDGEEMHGIPYLYVKKSTNIDIENPISVLLRK